MDAGQQQQQQQSEGQQEGMAPVRPRALKADSGMLVTDMT